DAARPDRMPSGLQRRLATGALLGPRADVRDRLNGAPAAVPDIGPHRLDPEDECLQVAGRDAGIEPGTQWLARAGQERRRIAATGPPFSRTAREPLRGALNRHPWSHGAFRRANRGGHRKAAGPAPSVLGTIKVTLGAPVR